MRSPLLRLVNPAHRAQAAWLLALMAASALTEGLGVMLLVPLLAAIEPGNTGGFGRSLAGLGLELTLGQALALFVVLVLVRGLINQARNTQAMRLELAVVAGLRRRAWRALLGADWRMLARLRRTDSASMLISNIDRVGDGINQAGGAFASLFTLGGLGLAGLFVTPLVTLCGALGGCLVLLAYRQMRRRAALLGERLGSAYDTLHGSLGDSLGALRTIKSLGSEARAEAAAFAGFSNLVRARLAYQRDLSMGQLTLQAGGAAVLAGLVWLAVTRWGLGAAAILPAVALFARTLPLLGVLQECWQNFAHSVPAIEAAWAMIDLAEAAREPELPPAPPPKMRTQVAVSHVSVRYSGSQAAALEQVSLTIRAGEIVLLGGPSGAGKSTLADVLGGLIGPDTGALQIDGKPLDPAERKAWRGRVAYVQQEPALLADTVRANLLWAEPDASDEHLRGVLHQAACQFVLDWPEGLETRIGDGGRTLSGGERQRLMLARALLRQPVLLILDEATSALDAANEAQVAAAIQQLKGRVTVLIIAHRGKLAELADRAYTLDKGRLVS